MTRRVAAAAWAIGSLVVVLLLAAAAIVLDVVLEEARYGPQVEPWSELAGVIGAIVPVALAAVATLITIRGARNRVATILTTAALLLAVSAFARPYGGFAGLDDGYFVVDGRVLVPPAADLAHWLVGWTATLGYGLLTAGLFLTFPDGSLPSRRWRPVAALAGAVIALDAARQAFGPGSATAAGVDLAAFGSLDARIAVLGRSMYVVAFASLVVVAVTALALVARYRRGSEIDRLQLKWFTLAAGVTAAVHVGLPVVHFAGSLTTNRLLALMLGQEAVWLLVAAAVAIAVLRYRLYDIDVVLNKAIVVGGISAFITLAYVAATTAVGTVVAPGAEPGAVASALAVAPVALGLAPVRSRTQRLANRAVYGERAAPYEVLAQFARELPKVTHVDDVLPRIAAAVGTGLAAASVEVHVRLSDGGVRVVTWPGIFLASDEAARVHVPIELHGEEIGLLVVTKRRGEGVTREDRRLLRLLADYGGAALHNVRLTLELENRRRELAVVTHELEASRRRLVDAEVAARHRLARDIGRDVTSRLREVEDVVRRTRGEPVDVATLDEALAMNTEALTRLRRIAHGVHAPLVDQLGLVEALQSHFRDERDRDVRVAGELDAPVDAVAAVALYTCCVEVAAAATGTVEIRVGQAAGRVDVRITAPGFDPRRHLEEDVVQHLADRVEAAGGSFDLAYEFGRTGTVRASVPVTVAP